MLIHNKYDGVTGKTQKNFFCKAEIHRKTKSLSRFFFDVRSWQLQFKSNSPPIQVQFKSNAELEINCLCNVISFPQYFVYFLHDLLCMFEYIDDTSIMLYILEIKGHSFAVFQPFLSRLITANVEVPC